MNLYEYNIKEGQGFIFIIADDNDDAFDIAIEQCEDVWPDIESDDLELISQLDGLPNQVADVFEFIIIRS